MPNVIYTVAERIEFVRKHEQGVSYQRISNDFAAAHPGRPTPWPSTIRRMVEKFRQTGNLDPRNERRSYPTRQLTDETRANVLRIARADGRTPSTRIAQEVGVSQSSVIRILHDQTTFLSSKLSKHQQIFYPSNSDVVDLTPTNFDRLVLRSDNIWIVEFYAPSCGHCQQLVPEYRKAATALKGVVKVGAVNADDHKSLSQKYGVRGFPTLKIFAADKNKPDDYEGARSAQAIVDAGINAAKQKSYASLGGKKSSSGSKSGDSKDVIELTDSNFDKLVLGSEDMWLVEFYAPWCGHCKSLAPQWAAAATELKGKVKLGALDATVHTVKASEYGVQGYPTIKYFAPGKKDSDSLGEFDGGRTSSDIVNWALEKLAENIPSPEIIQILNEKSLKDACESKPLCVVSVLPHILDCQADCRNGYLKVLKTLGEKYKKKMWGWVWAEAGAQPNIEEALEIGGFGYPAMAVVNVKKMKYSLLRGSFSQDGISEFLRDLSYGRGGTAPLKGAQLPPIYETEPWDGKDGEPPQEEDIDLSDIDLDEKDEL